MRLLAGILLGAILASPAGAQTLDARRLGMGMVATSDNGASTTANVAFRAVPKGTGWGSIPLPLGIIQYLSDHPSFDPNDSDFNVFSILDLVANPPMTLKLSDPGNVSSDISIFVAKDSLQVDLADVRKAIPKESMKFGGVYHLFGIGKSFGAFFVQFSPLVHVRNEISLSDKFRRALRDAEPFTSNTRYGIKDDGVAQAALAYQVGYAVRAFHAAHAESASADPRRNGGTAIYVGAAPKYLMGLAYGQIISNAGVTTGDTLFGSSNPVAVDMAGLTRHAAVGGEGGMGHGLGADLGTVLYWRNFELGVGVTDVGSTIHWSTSRNLLTYDDSLNQFTNVKVAQNAGFSSRIPSTATFNLAKRMGPTTLAADVVRNELFTGIHMGAETWLGRVALRGGTYRDSNDRWQFTGGTGLRFGGIGLDTAVGTNQRNTQEARAVELCASVTLY
ncbi:MAG: hypothetical protein E6K79_04460 [Candidatus Eisenbacteria bacterium]|jgi:hypothetical protein|uniref:DUF5723 domain-containing protein n=1 Tax=Eiseniibacteriota bacterium TaxID=2212470 RepID=A0A538TPQ3_UNCEI|nr:MAG: hypothetical protein E6K79_04460 [Candidatus Eisenbacteria bacterium]